jgi:hypothetical protein
MIDSEKIKDFKPIENFDWRIKAITTIAKECVSPAGNILKKGEPVVLCHPVKVKNNNTVIYTPEPTALFLNLSNKLYEDAKKIFDYANLMEEKAENENLYFDSLEFYIASIVSAYTALECFANERIPNNYEYIKLRDDKKCTESYIKDQIERYINLDIKISEILPVILKIKSPKGTKIYDEYLKIKKIRNSLIHMKSIDLEYKKEKEYFNHIWNNLINNGDYINYTLKAKKIIGYFLDNKPPRWFDMIPF